MDQLVQRPTVLLENSLVFYQLNTISRYSVMFALVPVNKLRTVRVLVEQYRQQQARKQQSADLKILVVTKSSVLIIRN